MSEYQYYEFLAIDRPLGDDEQTEVRSLSTRARITTTSFVNEYHWGNFRGDPNRLPDGGRSTVVGEWAVSHAVYHLALVSEADFVAVQGLRAPRE